MVKAANFFRYILCKIAQNFHDIPVYYAMQGLSCHSTILKMPLGSGGGMLAQYCPILLWLGTGRWHLGTGR